MSPAMISVGLVVILALQVKHVAELDRLFVVADEDLRLPAALALVNAEDRQLADERIGRHLEHVRQQRLVRIVRDT